MNIPNFIPDAGSEFIPRLAFLHQATASTSQKYHGGEKLRCGQIVGAAAWRKKGPRAQMLLQRNIICSQELEGLQKINNPPNIHQAGG